MEITWQPDPQSTVPLYQQISAYCRQQIQQGNWLVGDKLPAQRLLAQQFGVNLSTIITALNNLQADGILTSAYGDGTRVASNTWSLALDWQPYLDGQFNANLPTIQTINRLENKHYLRLSTGELAPELFPRRLVQTTLQTITPQVTQLNYLEPLGALNLRQALAKRLQCWQINAQPENILITSGSLQALELISVALLKPGATIYTEAATYLNSLQVFQSAAATLKGVAQDDAGLCYWQIPPSATTQQLLYTIPSFQNPTGSVMTRQRRQQLLQFAQKHQLPIIEDTAYQDLWLETPPPLPLKALDQANNVLYLGTISKTLAPGLRLGWIVGPTAVIRRLSDVKMQTDYGASSLAQQLLATLLADSAYDSYLTELRQQLRQRRDAALASLTNHLAAVATWQVPRGGFYIWLKLNPVINIERLFQAALKQHILFNPGSIYGEQQAIRLSFAYITPAEFERGIKELAQLIKRA
ncbi:aminotransferase-like domain-containing protein [Loigolactobacillus zhaoyuanensis]|uniref:aminotransferase-like domain-containing protein n=1 Tax=Loigolactobacillus zhaoyuanensis TaxID=2486017 RepID=UPI000F7379A9|nr:PLP-dependent aminotransferase family protein [Loigolactobacillus zhaoyuanensis]